MTFSEMMFYHESTNQKTFTERQSRQANCKITQINARLEAFSEKYCLKPLVYCAAGIFQMPLLSAWTKSVHSVDTFAIIQHAMK